MQTRTWINADSGTVEWSEYLHQPVTFSFGDLKERMTPQWIELQKRIRKQRTEMHWINQQRLDPDHDPQYSSGRQTTLKTMGESRIANQTLEDLPNESIR